MKELSMHILDIIQNSISADSKNIKIKIIEDYNKNILNFSIEDDGNGMDKAFLDNIKNPFQTTRTTRKVGLGIPMLEQTCSQCNGNLDIKSNKNIGTKISATMEYNNIDRPPMGNIADTIYLSIIMNENINFLYSHIINNAEFVLDTKELKEILGDISFKTSEISSWIRDTIFDGLSELEDSKNN